MVAAVHQEEHPAGAAVLDQAVDRRDGGDRVGGTAGQLDQGPRPVAQASGKCRMRSWPKRIMPPTVGTVFPWCSLTSRRVSRSWRLRARNGANDSEAARKSRSSEPGPGKGCSSKPSPREKRRTLLTTTRRLAYRRNTSFTLLPSSYS